MEALHTYELASVGPSSIRSDCSVYCQDVEIPAQTPSTVAAQLGHAAAPGKSSGSGNYQLTTQLAPDGPNKVESARAYSQQGNNRGSGAVRTSATRDGTARASPKKPLYMRLPLVEALANWFDQMWYAESVFVRYNEAAVAGAATKGSGRTKVVVDGSSGATQGSFWSVGAGSENAEITELKRQQRAGIQLLPLRFKDKQAEEEFVFNSSRLMEWRNLCLFALKVAATTCVYVILVASGAFGDWSQFPDSFKTGLHVVYVILMILAGLSLVVPTISWFKRRLEFSLYVLLALEAIVVALFVTYEKVVIYSSYQTQQVQGTNGNELCACSPRMTVLILSMELVFDAVVQLFMYFLVNTVSIVLPTRVRIAAWVQVAVLLIYAVPILTGQRYCKILIYPELLRILHAFTILGTAVAGAYASESKRRGLFYSWLTMKRQMKLLETERDKASDDNMRSGISELQRHCKQVEVSLMCAKTAPRGNDIAPHVKDAANHVEACLEILANSTDLYHTELQEELREKTFIKAFNVEKTSGKGLLAAGSQSVSRVKSIPAEETTADQARVAESPCSALLPCFMMDLASRVGIDLSFNPLAFHREVKGKDPQNSAFFECGYSLLWRYAADWGCDDAVLRSFLVEIESLYNELPYHNSIHGAMVAHLVGVFCRSTRLITQCVNTLPLGLPKAYEALWINSLGAAAILVAALCHDVGHPGRNSAFFSAGKSPLAILYNDRSVLENFHSALTFKVLSSTSCNIFKALAMNEIKEIRANIISLILATDMKTHFSALNRFRAGRQNPQFDHKKQRDDTWLVVEMCMRAADIGHGVVAWDQHFEWSSRVAIEFYLQGDEETRLGRGMSPLCDRDQHSNLARNQVGFLAHVVKPLFTELNSTESIKGAFQEAVDAIEANIGRWQQLQDSGVLVTFSPSAAECDEALKDHSLFQAGPAISIPARPHNTMDYEICSQGKNHVLDVSLVTETRCECCQAGNIACQHANIKVRINEHVK